MRELKTLEEAVALVDEWQDACTKLEGEVIRLDRAWALKYRALEAEMHRLQGLDNERFIEDATERRVNALTEDCPF